MPSEKIVEKYAAYIDLFDKRIFPFDDSIEECLQNIFKDIDIRTQEQIIKKVMLTHKLLYIDKKDYSFMCMELILAVMLFIYNEDAKFLEGTVDMDNLVSVFTSSKGKGKTTFSTFFKEKFEQILLVVDAIFLINHYVIFCRVKLVYMVLLFLHGIGCMEKIKIL